MFVCTPLICLTSDLIGIAGEDLFKHKLLPHSHTHIDIHTHTHIQACKDVNGSELPFTWQTGLFRARDTFMQCDGVVEYVQYQI